MSAAVACFDSGYTLVAIVRWSILFFLCYVTIVESRFITHKQKGVPSSYALFDRAIEARSKRDANTNTAWFSHNM